MLQKIFRIKKSRKYPIKRDDQGRSLRQRSFILFDAEESPVDVAKQLRAKINTVERYYHDWRRLGPDFEKQFALVKGLFNKNSPQRGENIELFARAFGISEEELKRILIQPHGLRRILAGKFYFPKNADMDRKRRTILEVALAISDYLEKDGLTFTDVRFAFEQMMKESQDYRDEEDADTKDENLRVGFARRLLEVNEQMEQEGRPKRDKLTDEEIEAAIKLGEKRKVDSLSRELEMAYWLRIGELIGEGLTTEQAREKMVTDLIEKGDLKAAEMVRGYQNRIHPLNTEKQAPPPSPSQQESPE